MKQYIRISTGIPADRSGGSLRLAADGKFVGEQFLHPSVIHNEHKDIGRRASNLQSIPSALNSYSSGRSKRARFTTPTRNKPSTVFAPDDESSLLNAWNNHDAA